LADLVSTQAALAVLRKEQTSEWGGGEGANDRRTAQSI
jgi:hypothetical protein